MQAKKIFWPEAVIPSSQQFNILMENHAQFFSVFQNIGTIADFYADEANSEELQLFLNFIYPGAQAVTPHKDKNQIRVIQKWQLSENTFLTRQDVKNKIQLFCKVIDDPWIKHLIELTQQFQAKDRELRRMKTSDEIDVNRSEQLQRDCFLALAKLEMTLVSYCDLCVPILNYGSRSSKIFQDSSIIENQTANSMEEKKYIKDIFSFLTEYFPESSLRYFYRGIIAEKKAEGERTTQKKETYNELALKNFKISCDAEKWDKVYSIQRQFCEVYQCVKNLAQSKDFSPQLPNHIRETLDNLLEIGYPPAVWLQHESLQITDRGRDYYITQPTTPECVINCIKQGYWPVINELGNALKRYLKKKYSIQELQTFLQLLPGFQDIQQKNFPNHFSILYDKLRTANNPNQNTNEEIEALPKFFACPDNQQKIMKLCVEGVLIHDFPMSVEYLVGPMISELAFPSMRAIAPKRSLLWEIKKYKQHYKQNKPHQEVFVQFKDKILDILQHIIKPNEEEKFEFTQQLKIVEEQFEDKDKHLTELNSLQRFVEEQLEDVPEFRKNIEKIASLYHLALFKECILQTLDGEQRKEWEYLNYSSYISDPRDETLPSVKLKYQITIASPIHELSAPLSGSTQSVVFAKTKALQEKLYDNFFLIFLNFNKIATYYRRKNLADNNIYQWCINSFFPNLKYSPQISTEYAKKQVKLILQFNNLPELKHIVNLAKEAKEIEENNQNDNRYLNKLTEIQIAFLNILQDIEPLIRQCSQSKEKTTKETQIILQKFYFLIEHMPRTPLHHLYMGIYLSYTGKNKEALQQFTIACRKNPLFPTETSYCQLYIYYHFQKELKGKFIELKKSIPEKPETLLQELIDRGYPPAFYLLNLSYPPISNLEEIKHIPYRLSSNCLENCVAFNYKPGVPIVARIFFEYLIAQYHLTYHSTILNLTYEKTLEYDKTVTTSNYLYFLLEFYLTLFHSGQEIEKYSQILKDFPASLGQKKHLKEQQKYQDKILNFLITHASLSASFLKAIPTIETTFKQNIFPKTFILNRIEDYRGASQDSEKLRTLEDFQILKNEISIFITERLKPLERQSLEIQELFDKIELELRKLKNDEDNYGNYLLALANLSTYIKESLEEIPSFYYSIQESILQPISHVANLCKAQLALEANLKHGVGDEQGPISIKTSETKKSRVQESYETHLKRLNSQDAGIITKLNFINEENRKRGRKEKEKEKVIQNYTSAVPGATNN